MRRHVFFLLAISAIFAGCSGKRTFSVAQIRTPDPSWINSVVYAEGYFQPHGEEDLLTSEPHRLSEWVELSFLPMMAGVENAKRPAWRSALGTRLGGKFVSVRAKVRVGPFGVLNSPIVYLEVESIDETTSRANSG